MKHLLCIIILLLFFFVGQGQSKIALPPGEWPSQEVVEYQGTTGETITVAWDIDLFEDNPDGVCPLGVYQLKIQSIERPLDVVWIDKAINRERGELTFNFPSTGHWIPMIRVEQKCELPYTDPDPDVSPWCWNHDGKDDKREGYEYSDWCKSTDDTCAVIDVDGEHVPKAWQVFVWLPKPTWEDTGLGMPLNVNDR